MTDSTSIVRYASFSIEELDKQSEAVSDLSGRQFMALEVGENVVRFLPSPLGRTSPFRVTALHFVDAVPGLDKLVVFACPRHELKQTCIVCQRAEEMSRSANPIDRERGSKISAGLQVYANVLNRHSGTPQVKTLKFGKTIFDQLKAIRKNPRLGGDFTDPTEKGFDVVIIREGTGRTDTKYTVVPARESSVLWPDVAMMQDLIELQPNLDSLVEPIVPAQLEAIFMSAAGRGPAPPQGVPGTAVRSWSPPAAARPVVQTVGTAVQDVQSVAADANDDFD
jgi:hypothetical protein